MQKEAQLILMAEDGNMVELTVCQGFNFVPDSNSNDKFLTDCENQDTVVIFSQYGFERIFTPWSDTYSSVTIPEDICRNVKKKDGWEMAFCALGNNAGRDLNYFGLYNRYLGILRVFYFNTDASGNGTEHSFEINMGTSNPTMKYPFYNALAYSIPTVHSSVNNAVDLCGTGILQAFKCWSTPYTAMSSTALSRGWTAFDIDMSSYVPEGNDYFSSNEIISMACRTVTNQSVSLAGSLSADISGKYSSATPAASSTGGISSTLSSLGNMLGDVQNSALAQIDNALTGSPLNKAFYYAGTVCNIASFAYDWIMGDDGLNEANIDSMPGKIELNLTGKIDLKGYIQSFSGNQISPLSLKSSVFRTTNPDTHIGEGVWSLADDPVIYVADDHFIGSTRRINLTVGADHTYSTSEGSGNEMRLVTFMDPESIKLNINTDLFPDISDVEVVSYYGVYPDMEKGHTGIYRNLMQLEQPATVDLVDRASVKEGSVFRTTNSGNKMAYHQLAKETLISPSVDGEASSCSMVQQEGSDYSYYGCLLTDGTGNKRGFIVDPQVFFPVSEDGKTIYDAEIPDFVVCVFVTFKSAGRSFQFARRYLPDVRLISGNALKTSKATIDQYVEKCKKRQPVNFLNNGTGAAVVHPNGAAQMEKAQIILNHIIND